MLPADRDDLIARALAELADPRAPRSLLPRVLAAAEELSQRPWYTRTWHTWPLGLQLLSLALLVLVAVGGAAVTPVIRAELTDSLWHLAHGRMMEISGAAGRLGAAANACVVLWRALIAPLAAYALVLAAMAGLVCAAFATVLSRVALSRP